MLPDYNFFRLQIQYWLQLQYHCSYDSSLAREWIVFRPYSISTIWTPSHVLHFASHLLYNILCPRYKFISQLEKISLDLLKHINSYCFLNDFTKISISKFTMATVDFVPYINLFLHLLWCLNGTYGIKLVHL